MMKKGSLEAALFVYQTVKPGFTPADLPLPP
jgi:hypothetical protein